MSSKGSTRQTNSAHAEYNEGQVAAAANQHHSTWNCPYRSTDWVKIIPKSKPGVKAGWPYYYNSKTHVTRVVDPKCNYENDGDNKTCKICGQGKRPITFEEDRAEMPPLLGISDVVSINEYTDIPRDALNLKISRAGNATFTATYQTNPTDDDIDIYLKDYPPGDTQDIHFLLSVRPDKRWEYLKRKSLLYDFWSSWEQVDASLVEEENSCGEDEATNNLFECEPIRTAILDRDWVSGPTLARLNLESDDDDDGGGNGGVKDGSRPHKKQGDSSDEDEEEVVFSDGELVRVSEKGLKTYKDYIRGEKLKIRQWKRRQELRQGYNALVEIEDNAAAATPTLSLKRKRGTISGGRKEKRRKTKRRKKRICCVGIGCPEWKHCIHVLGDGAKYRPKRKSTLVPSGSIVYTF